MIQNWLKADAPKIAKELLNINSHYLTEDVVSGFGMKAKVAMLVDLIRSAIFPNIYSSDILKPSEFVTAIEERLGHAAILLDCMIAEVLVNDCELQQQNKEVCDKCKDKARLLTLDFMNALPAISKTLGTDIKAAYDGDPAAISHEEILLAYPGFESISIFRLAHKLYKLEIPLLPRIMTELAHGKTGIDIHPGATIGDYFFIDHGTGVVIGETCTIGEHVKIYQGVTLGAKSFPLDENGNPIKGVKRHPDIEDHVVIYSGATILGGNTVIGKGSIIGGNVWLTSSVEPLSTVYNSAPSPIIKK